MPKKQDIGISNRIRQEAFMQALRLSGENGRTLTELTTFLNKNHDWNFSRKTYERDLAELSNEYEISESTDSPARYSLLNPSNFKFKTSLNEREIQTIVIALELLKKSTPGPFTRMAKEVELSLSSALDANTAKEMNRLRDLHSVGNSMSGRGKLPHIGEIEILLVALRKARVFECNYSSPYQKDTKKSQAKRRFLPLSLEMFGGSPYLLIQDLDTPDRKIKRIKVFRVSNVKLLDEKHATPSREMLKKWKNAFAGYGGPEARHVDIEIIGNSGIQIFFDEQEIHPDQKLTQVSDDHWKLQVSMPISLPIVRLLAGLSPYIESISPSELRDEVVKSLNLGLTNITSKSKYS